MSLSNQNETLEKYLKLHHGFGKPEELIAILETCTSPAQVAELVSQHGYSGDAYQIFQPAFAGLIELYNEATVALELDLENSVGFTPDEMLYFLTKMGTQPYFVVNIRSKLTDGKSQVILDGEAKTRLYDEGLTIILNALKHYLANDQTT